MAEDGSGWPQPGMRAYHKGDWCPGDVPTPEDLDDKKLEGVIVRLKGGRLGVVDLDGAERDRDSRIFVDEFGENWFPTRAEALRAAAADQREYGNDCLELADRLEALARQVENAGGGKPP